jgi:dolichyl-phosphate beta-glucosyltransferase
MKLSVIVPAFNEEKRILSTLERIHTFLSTRSDETEVIVVDDGSTDCTREVTKEAFSKYKISHRLILNGQNRGKGYSIKNGMLDAKGDYVFFTDADESTPIETVDLFIKTIDTGFDIVIGSRALPDSKIEIRQNVLRELMGKCFNRLARLLTIRGIHDSQCGFKCFKREVACRLFSLQKIDGFSFDVEILYLAQKFGYKIAEIPITWRNSPASTVRIATDPIKMFWDLFRIRIYHI